MLPARKSEAERIAGLEMGADDYVVKPSAPRSWSAACAPFCAEPARPPAEVDEAPLEFDGLTIDTGSRIVAVRGEERDLSAKEFDLLATLARRPRQVFNRERLLELVWGSAECIDPSTVTVHVRRVREKIEEDPSRPRSSRPCGVGYRFEP